MFEAKWLACNDPVQMVQYVLGKTGDRKLRLFACACVRRVWGLLRDERSRAAVHVAERFADRQATLSELRAARAAARAAGHSLVGPVGEAPSPARDAAHAAEATVDDTGYDVACRAALSAAHAREPSRQGEPVGTGVRMYRQVRVYARAVRERDEARAQCNLLRDSFGNPFRPVAFEPRWLSWHGGCVVQLARDIYEERRFDHLPILADALEEAGCDDEEILWHCRAETEHARGCWVVDSILGRK
jgi:hypothetical protein